MQHFSRSCTRCAICIANESSCNTEHFLKRCFLAQLLSPELPFRLHQLAHAWVWFGQFRLPSAGSADLGAQAFHPLPPPNPSFLIFRNSLPIKYMKGSFKQSMQSPWFSPRWLPAGSVEGTFKRRRGSCARSEKTSLLLVHLLPDQLPSPATCQGRVPKHSKQSPREKTKQII